MLPIHRLSCHISELQALVSSFHQSITQNPILALELLAKALDQNPNIKTLKNFHSKIFYLNSHQNPSLGIKLMRAYAACGEPGMTRKVFDEIFERNVVFYNVMIRSYVNNRWYNDALFVFRDMVNGGFKPDNYTYPCVLKACSCSDNLSYGLQLHGAVLKVRLDLNLFVGNGLIAMYGKCGCLVEARHVLDEMVCRDVISWNSMVAGYAQNMQFDDALQICREMDDLGQQPDCGTMASLMPAVANTSSENVLYVEKIFENLERKSLISWNVMIRVYMKNSMPKKAVDMYLQMEKGGMEPDAITCASVLPACGDLSALLLGRRIHEYIERKKLCPNLLLENSLIDMYARCGCLEDAKRVFDRMKFRDVASWTSLISAYGTTGQGSSALALFTEMLNSGQSPDSIAFVAILSACSHSGLLDEGKLYFKQMTNNYRITPRIEHFACFVDLLGRAGRVDEAYNFIKQMPIEANERVWGTLLSACRVYSNMDIGLVAADNLLQLAPEQSGYYVLLSNIYAKAGRWKEVTEIRSLMKKRKIRKTPGISNVELNNQVHTFLAGDTSHPQSKEIYEELGVLVGKMKELGYVPETDSALHDVEEEDKEGHLAVHSEKLAIVFALLNTQESQIRITKNLRVCGDCHIAAKLISKIVEREIIVRDTHRFHHFKDGVCSCGDYW
ncbi:putative pentatricopeptide repeat-containing protein At3g49142 [Cicer arietinum]|uniref:Pentatricopeptide repeat-containing protein At3g49142 n=1 Tax=Cicer arietinum TaxID=3827 RepID=A0A1S3EDI9_CICAR|nr:putative pentatricopeptide repeat-containing protein At3g49142 [Cicer arietinum]XP_004509859.1 putative pentatricopeptide repeat-containing protein At3g49142 [Cicer arietinum]XP_012573906.1 putative pentatricopeptide repeat-containing protein At3g49142 [Cicer arietinum]XP_012573907.1 putative pentatricopeptide repeat-containing protein At3g49142 [Cicer arietinum]